MQGQPTVHSIRAGPHSPHHAFLAFSSPSASHTQLLDISGTHFVPCHMPALAADEASVLLAGVSEGLLVQVTAQVSSYGGRRGWLAWQHSSE